MSDIIGLFKKLGWIVGRRPFRVKNLVGIRVKGFQEVQKLFWQVAKLFSAVSDEKLVSGEVLNDLLDV